METSTSPTTTVASAPTEPTIDDRPLTAAEARMARFARAILLALLIAIGVASVVGAGVGTSSAEGDRSGDARLGGDFPAFYAAGSIVRDGDIASLYDSDRQQLEQADLGIDGYLAFAYPPHVAILYAPLAGVDFPLAYALNTLLMALALVGAVHVLAKPVPLLARWRWPLLAGAFTFYPLFTAVGGGQNASVTVLLLALLWRGLDDDRPALAGVAAGLMFYRPQYALPVIGVLLLARQFRAVGWSLVVSSATWAGVATLLGVSWVFTWVDAVLPFVERDAEVNASNSISILGSLQAAWGVGGVSLVVGATGAAVVVLAIMWFWVQPDRFPLAARMGILSIGMILISPHTMFYDASLLLIAGAALLAGARAFEDRLSVVRLLALVWVAAFVHIAAGGLGFTPLAIIVAAAFCGFAWQAIVASRSQTLEVG